MTPFRVLVVARAEREIRRAVEWWRANRLEAPELLLDELAATLEQIALVPLSGAPYPIERPHGVRRWLLPATRYHVYYTVDLDLRTATVRAFWHATRGQAPKLR